MPLPQYNVELTSVEQLTNNTLGLRFYLDDERFSFKAGQFVSLHFDIAGEQYKRSYSIACAPASFKKNKILEFALGQLPGGKANECFSEATVGEQYIISGPAGVLTLPEALPKRIVLIGTGTGMAPYRAMIPELNMALEKEICVHIIMGVRQRCDLFYLQDFQALVHQYAHAYFDVCFSQESNIDNEKSEYGGYVQNRFKHLNLVPDRDLVYLCGNPAMIDDSSNWLAEAGFGYRQFKKERYIFSR